MTTPRKLAHVYEIMEKDAYRGEFHDSFVVFPSAEAGWEYLLHRSSSRNLLPDDLPDRFWTFNYVGEIPITEADFNAYMIDDFKESFTWELLPVCVGMLPMLESDFMNQLVSGNGARLKALPKILRLKSNIEKDADFTDEWVSKALAVIQDTLTQKSAYWWMIVGSNIEFNMLWLHRSVNEM